MAALLQDRKISLELMPEAHKWLATNGYAPYIPPSSLLSVWFVWLTLFGFVYCSAYGARPLKRLVQRNILNPLATMMLSGAVRDGDVIKVDVLPFPPGTILSDSESHLSLTPYKNVLPAEK